MDGGRDYADDWDDYVETWDARTARDADQSRIAQLAFPGDEWGHIADWDRHAASLLLPYLPDGGIAVEIGPGSGKYTVRVLDRASRIVCFDVSQRFIDIARRRLAGRQHAARATFERLEMQDGNEIEAALDRCGLKGRVDLVFSVDSMQHVDYHTLFAYWVNASACLKDGGHLAMTVATCTTEGGFARLAAEAAWCYGGIRRSKKFHFLSREMVENTLDRLGFELVRCVEARDLDFVAKKVRPSLVRLAAPPRAEGLHPEYAWLQERLAASESDREARFAIIQAQALEIARIPGLRTDVAHLAGQLDVSERDRAERLAVIHRQADELARIPGLEADIEHLKGRLVDAETRLAAREAAIDRQATELAALRRGPAAE